MIEIELKYALLSGISSKLLERLCDMEHTATVNNTDTYYDTPAFDLLQQAVFVRIRNNRFLQFKFNESEHKVHGQITEHSFPLSTEQSFIEKVNVLFAQFLARWIPTSSILSAIAINGLIELARIENRREEYFHDDIIVSVDHVKDLGDFLEVETQCPEGTDTSHALEKLQAFVATLDLQQIHTGYVELWLRIHNPQAYHLARYQL